MEDFFQKITQIIPSGYTFTLLDVVTVLTFSMALSMFACKVYSRMHDQVSYSKSYVHTLVIVSMTVSAIMLIVGSNIARAFTLLGALSIVRFRNAIKETRDVGFIFFVMAIGMACGTRFYSMAILMTLFISGVIWLMARMDFGSKTMDQALLKITLPLSENELRGRIGDILNKHFISSNLINVESLDPDFCEIKYAVVSGAKADPLNALQELKSSLKNAPVSLLVGDRTIEV